MRGLHRARCRCILWHVYYDILWYALQQLHSMEYVHIQRLSSDCDELAQVVK